MDTFKEVEDRLNLIDQRIKKLLDLIVDIGGRTEVTLLVNDNFSGKKTIQVKDMLLELMKSLDIKPIYREYLEFIKKDK